MYLRDLNLPRLVPVKEEANQYLHLSKRYPSLEGAAKEVLEAAGVDFSKLSRERANMLLWAVCAQEGFVNTVAQRGNRTFSQAFNKVCKYGAGGDLESVSEAPVTTADIATFTTQSIAFVLDLFEAFDWLDVVTTRPMLGPTAFIHSRTFTREDDGEFYSAGSALNTGRDPSYTECPEECSPSNRIGVSIDGELLEAECRSVAAEYCMPTQWHVSSQYGLSLDEMLDEGMVEALQQNIQQDGLDQLRAGAGGTAQWSQTAPAGYYSSANPKEWQRVLLDRVRQADMAIRTDPGGRAGATHVLGDANFIGYLLELVDLELDFDLRNRGNGPGTLNEVTAFQGITRSNRYAVYLFTDMADDTGLVMRKDDADPTFLWAPWIPFTDLGTLVYPRDRKVEKGMITLFGQAVLRSGRIREIQITA